MKKYFWLIAIVMCIGLFTAQSANAGGHRDGRGNRHAQRAYRAGYHNGARDAHRFDRRHPHRDYYYGHYHHRNHYPHYRRHPHYAPRPVVNVSVPLPPRPRVVIHN